MWGDYKVDYEGSRGGESPRMRMRGYSTMKAEEEEEEDEGQGDGGRGGKKRGRAPTSG
jgi:hypothetical protein